LEERLQEMEGALGSKIGSSSASTLREAEDLRAENMKLQQQLLPAEKCAEENILLRRTLAEAESRIKVLVDENEHLRVQLSLQFKKYADAEQRQQAQKQLFCKVLEVAKHDRDQSDGHHAKAITCSNHAATEEYRCDAAKQTGALAKHVNLSPSVPCTEYKPKDESAHADVVHASQRFLHPQRRSQSPIRRNEGRPRTEASSVDRARRPRAIPSLVAPEHEKLAANMQPAKSVLSQFIRTLDSSLSSLKAPRSRSPSASAVSAITPNFCREIGRVALRQQSELESNRHAVVRQQTAPSQLESSRRGVVRQQTAPSPLEISYRKSLPATFAAKTHVT